MGEVITTELIGISALGFAEEVKWKPLRDWFMDGGCEKYLKSINWDRLLNRQFKQYLKLLPKIPKRKRVPIPKSASKEERNAYRVLRDSINADGSIGPNYGHYMQWESGDKEITLDSKFTVEELEALAWWMRNK